MKRPIKVGKRPINEGKRPIEAKVLVGVSVGSLMGCFRAPPTWRKTAPLKRPIKRSMKIGSQDSVANPLLTLNKTESIRIIIRGVPVTGGYGFVLPALLQKLVGEFFFYFSQGNLENLVGNLEGIFRGFFLTHRT